MNSFEEIADLLEPEENLWDQLLAVARKRSMGNPGATACYERVIMVLRAAEVAMLVGNSAFLEHDLGRQAEVNFRNALRAGISEITKDERWFALAVQASQSPDPGGDFFSALAADGQHSSVTLVAQVIVLHGRNRRNAIRIAELEAQVADLQSTAAGDPPVVDLTPKP